MENLNASPTKKEIIIKCSLEEMVKAFFKEYMIVWHDPNVNNQESQQYIAKLKKICGVFTFTEWEKAKDYIQATQAICHVITSGTNGELLVKEIFENNNVSDIYVFCVNKEHHSNWAQNYKKILCVETEIEAVVYRIEQNQLNWEKKGFSLKLNLPAFAPIFNDSDKSEMNHLHRYLKVIPNFKNREQAKDDFVKLSRVIYSDAINANLIEEFEKNYNEYNKEQALRWYTRESFFYKVTNNCLRIATSDSIQYCRLLLQDLERAIKEQYQTKSKNYNELLYRGAYLSQEEWLSLKENQDKEIEMHGFLSVSKVKNVALHFMETDPSKKVLITIIVPGGPNEDEQGFAEMHEYSEYPQEKEVLFNVRSRFTVLETEDDYEYSGALKCRHLVLLYGAQGFRRFITEQNPVQDVSIPSLEDLSCAHCKVESFDIPENLLFISLIDPKKQICYCKKCIDYGTAPFLRISIRHKGGKAYSAKVKGCLLINSSGQQTPFYGYKCCNCQAKKQKHYFICTDCGAKRKRWCEDCIEKEAFGCIEAGHNILLEKSPFSFWCEKMSVNESKHLKFQNDLVQKGGEVFQQAEMYFESHKYEKAIEYYSLYIEKNKANLKDPNLAACYNNIANVYKNKGEYKEALEYNLKSLDLRKAIYGDSHPSVATTYNNIAGVYDDQGEFEKALEYYLNCLEIEKSVYGDNNNEVATTYSNIGMVYKNQGEYKNALESHLKSLGIRKAVYGGDNHPEVANSYNNAGLVYKNLGDYEKALEYYLKSLDIFKSVYGENHPNTAGSYNNIGGLYMIQEETEVALEYILKAIKIQKSVHGENHPEIAVSYNNIGMIYSSHGEYIKAHEYYLKALDIQKSAYGENHPSVATSYNNIAGAYKDQEKYMKAIEYFLKSLEIRKSLYGDNHPDIAVSVKNLANVYFDQEEYKKALFYYSKCLDIEKSVYGGDNDGVAQTYNRLGTVYKNLGDYEKALEHYWKFLDISKSIYGEDDKNPSIAAAYKNIGAVYKDQGDLKIALEYYLKFLDIFMSVCGENHPDIASSYNDVGELYMEKGEPEKALGYLLKSLDIQRSVYGEEHPEVAVLYEGIGLVYFKQEKFKETLEYFSKALDIRKVVNGDDSPETMELQDFVNDIKMMMNRNKP